MYLPKVYVYKCPTSPESPWHIASFMQQHTKYFWTHLVVLCSLEKEGGVAVVRGKMLSSNFNQSLKVSGFMVLLRQLGTQGKKG